MIGRITPLFITVPELAARIGDAIARPGISPQFLSQHKIRHVEDFEAFDLVGFRASGLYIPYFGLNSPELIVNGRRYGRLRLDRPTLARYLSPRDSGAQLYIPNGAQFGPELFIVEGEFKALALCEAGIRAVAIGGLTSAMSDGKLIPGLASVISKYRPKIVYFLGDNDTAFLFNFSYEAVKLTRALPEGCVVKLPRIPVDMPKGIDDVKESLGNDFMDFWQKIKSEAIEVSRKISADAIAVQIATKEIPLVNGHGNREELFD
jgi:hypothetical protein